MFKVVVVAKVSSHYCTSSCIGTYTCVSFTNISSAITPWNPLLLLLHQAKNISVNSAENASKPSRPFSDTFGYTLVKSPLSVLCVNMPPLRKSTWNLTTPTNMISLEERVISLWPILLRAWIRPGMQTVIFKRNWVERNWNKNNYYVS